MEIKDYIIGTSIAFVLIFIIASCTVGLLDGFRHVNGSYWHPFGIKCKNLYKSRLSRNNPILLYSCKIGAYLGNEGE